MTVVLEEMRKLLPGVALLAALTLGGAALLGRFSAAFVLGVALGVLFSFFHFWLIGVSSAQVAQLPAAAAQRKMTTGYFLRFALMALAIFLAIKAPFINGWGFIIPLFFPKLTLYGKAIFRKGAKL